MKIRVTRKKSRVEPQAHRAAQSNNDKRLMEALHAAENEGWNGRPMARKRYWRSPGLPSG